MSIILFSDAGLPTDAGQLCHIGELLIDDNALGPIFHFVLWSSRKAHCPSKSTGAAEIIAVGEGAQIGKIIAKVNCVLLSMKLDLIIEIDSNDLLTMLTANANRLISRLEVMLVK